MAATDYAKQVYDKIWALLEAHAPFADRFKANNRIKCYGRPYPFKSVTKGVGDVPEVLIVMGDFADEQFTTAPRFGNPTRGATVWTEEYRIVLTAESCDFAVAGQQIAEVRTALRKGGPKLGVDAVSAWGPLAGSRLILSTGVDEAGNPVGERRLQTTIRMPVKFRLNNEDLLT